VPRFFLSVAQGFASRTVAERRAQNERLFVMRFAREGQVERAGGEALVRAPAHPQHAHEAVKARFVQP